VAERQGFQLSAKGALPDAVTNTKAGQRRAVGGHPNPNEPTKSKSKWRKCRWRANQIKSNGAPAGGGESNPNQIPAQKTQMGPNGGARRAPPFAIWRF
jgi:hypothetical protein